MLTKRGIELNSHAAISSGLFDAHFSSVTSFPFIGVGSPLGLFSSPCNGSVSIFAMIRHYLADLICSIDTGNICAR